MTIQCSYTYLTSSAADPTGASVSTSTGGGGAVAGAAAPGSTAASNTGTSATSTPRASSSSRYGSAAVTAAVTCAGVPATSTCAQWAHEKKNEKKKETHDDPDALILSPAQARHPQKSSSGHSFTAVTVAACPLPAHCAPWLSQIFTDPINKPQLTSGYQHAQHGATSAAVTAASTPRNGV